MSVENLKEYARRCAADPELRAKAKEIGMTDMDEHIRHAESLGLDWTTDDLMAFRKEVVDDEGDFADLTEDELERISGGAQASLTAAIASAIAAMGVGSAAVGPGDAGDW